MLALAWSSSLGCSALHRQSAFQRCCPPTTHQTTDPNPASFPPPLPQTYPPRASLFPSQHHVEKIRFPSKLAAPPAAETNTPGAARWRPRGRARGRQRTRSPRSPATQTTIFSPDGRLYQVEYALEAISHAGTAIGILAKDGIVLAAERKVTSKLLEQDTSAEKLYILNEYAGIFGPRNQSGNG